VIHDPQKVKRIRADAARGLQQVENLKVVDDASFKQQLQRIEYWFGDIERIFLKSHEDEKRSFAPGQESLFLDGADLLLKITFIDLEKLQKIFDEFGPNVKFVG
jgi:basic membrane lipoprotein Med (substrate-binding protein (PBP1-ABC) superfamily)